MTNLALPLRQIALTVALMAAVVGVVASVVLAPTGFAARTSVPVAENAAAGSNNAYARTAFRVSNNARQGHDRTVLRGNRCLKRAALRQARAMAAAGELSHQDLGRIQRDCNVGWVGENVAYGYATGRELVRDGWMRSAGHRANILREEFRLMGLAAVKVDGRWWAAQVFGAR